MASHGCANVHDDGVDALGSIEKHFQEWFAELQIPRLRSG